MLLSLNASYKLHPLEKCEVIIVDNEGTKDIEGIATDQSWAVKIAYIRCKERGKNYALNEGVRESRHEWLLFLDDDVALDKDYFLYLKKSLIEWPDAAVIGGRVVADWPNRTEGSLPDEVIGQVKTFAYSEFSPAEGTGLRPRGEAVMENNMLIRRSDLEAIGGFDTACGPATGRYRMGTHGDIFRKLAQMNRAVVYIDKMSVRHFIRPDQLTSRWLMRRGYSFGRSLAYLRYRARGLDGRDSLPRLIRLWIVRCARETVFTIVRKPTPRVTAQLERNMLSGIIYERIFARRARQRMK